MSRAIDREDRPLRIGVTGHRFLAGTERIEAGIDEALQKIAAAFPGRPLRIVSALAEGADRLVAHRILERHPDARLLVPLPMPKDEYAADFASAASREEFERLLARAACVLEPQAPADDAARGGERRNALYQAAGERLVDHSDLLIAVWDGRRGQGRGGTAGVVALARRRGLPLVWIRAGNRHPGTNEPTSLGDEQGRVSFEQFDAPGG